jgi:peptidyl-prolyl cis-trans isomerase SurA
MEEFKNKQNEDVNPQNQENNKNFSEEKEATAANEELASSQNQNSKTKPLWQKPWLWIVIVVVIGGIITALTWADLGIFSKEGQKEDGKVVATVNGEKITQAKLNAELTQAQQSAPNNQSSQNQSQLEGQMLDSLINQTLVLQEAEKQGISVSKEEIESSYQQIVNGFQNEEAFEKELQNRDLSKSDLKDSIRRQQIIQKYIQNNVDADQIEVTDKEIQSQYDQLTSQYEGDDAPALEEIKEQIKQQIKSQKQNQKVQELVEQLKEAADIQKNI